MEAKRYDADIRDSLPSNIRMDNRYWAWEEFVEPVSVLYHSERKAFWDERTSEWTNDSNRITKYTDDQIEWIDYHIPVLGEFRDYDFFNLDSGSLIESEVPEQKSETAITEQEGAEIWLRRFLHVLCFPIHEGTGRVVRPYVGEYHGGRVCRT